jgi:hypothetical protein
MPMLSMKTKKPMKPTLEIAEITDDAGLSSPALSSTSGADALALAAQIALGHSRGNVPNPSRPRLGWAG